MIEETKNQKIQGKQDISAKTYTRGKNKFNKSSKEFFQQQQQTCSGRMRRGFNTFTDKAANFLECTRLFSNQKLDQLKYSIQNQKQSEDIMQSTKSENSQPANVDSKVSTKDDHSIVKQKQLEEIQLPAKNYSIRNVFKFIKRYTEYYDQSYSERQQRFGITFEQVQVERQEQYQRKLKTFWGQLKRLLLCQGGNQIQDIQNQEKQKESSKWSENNSDNISRSMSKMQKRKKQPKLHQSESKNDSLLYIQQPRQIEEEVKNQPQDQFQQIKYNKRSKKKPKNMVKIVDKEGQQIKVGQQTKTTQQQQLYRHPNLQDNPTKATNYRSTYEERQNNQYDYKKALINVIHDNGNNIPKSNRNTANNNDGRQDNINKNINNTNNTNNNITNNTSNNSNNKNNNVNNQMNNNNINNKNPSQNTALHSQQNQGDQKNAHNKNIFQFDEQLEQDLQQNFNMNESRKQLNKSKDNQNGGVNNTANLNNTNGNVKINSNLNLNTHDDSNKRQNNNSYNYNYNYNPIETNNLKNNQQNNNQQNNNQTHVNPDTTNNTVANKKFSNTINNFGTQKPKIPQYNEQQNQQGDSSVAGYNQTGYQSNNSQALKKKKKLRAKVNYDLSKIQQPPADDVNFFHSNNQGLTNQSSIQDDHNASGVLQSKKKKNKRKAHLVIDQGLQQEVIDLEQM